MYTCVYIYIYIYICTRREREIGPSGRRPCRPAAARAPPPCPPGRSAPSQPMKLEPQTPTRAPDNQFRKMQD